jgi:hypothetical protein
MRKLLSELPGQRKEMKEYAGISQIHLNLRTVNTNRRRRQTKVIRTKVFIVQRHVEASKKRNKRIWEGGKITPSTHITNFQQSACDPEEKRRRSRPTEPSHEIQAVGHAVRCIIQDLPWGLGGPVGILWEQWQKRERINSLSRIASAFIQSVMKVAHKIVPKNNYPLIRWK